MNQQCKVCGEPAAGFHFGAFTCEGCKSFFGRTYNNISSISECKNNGECIINKKNRTACKACRLRKCLFVGMSKSGSRYGRRSNWFKIHCLLQEQQQQHQQQQHQHQQQQHPTTPPQIQQNFESYNIHHQADRQNQQQKLQNNNINQNKTAAIIRSPGLINNSYIPTHLINGGSICPTNKSNPRTSSPSDSGASSADPEDTGSNRDDGGMSDSPITEKNFSKLLTTTTTTTTTNAHIKTAHLETTIRSLSEPLKSFSPLSGSNNPFLSLPHVANSSIIPHSLSAAINVQEEPIDLSVKTRKRCRTTSPPTTLDIPKLSPLDLTLVRSSPLSG